MPLPSPLNVYALAYIPGEAKETYSVETGFVGEAIALAEGDR